PLRDRALRPSQRVRVAGFCAGAYSADQLRIAGSRDGTEQLRRGSVDQRGPPARIDDRGGERLALRSLIEGVGRGACSEQTQRGDTGGVAAHEGHGYVAAHGRPGDRSSLDTVLVHEPGHVIRDEV